MRMTLFHLLQLALQIQRAGEIEIDLAELGDGFARFLILRVQRLAERR